MHQNQVDVLLKLENAVAVAKNNFEGQLLEDGYVIEKYTDENPVVTIAFHPYYYQEVNDLKATNCLRTHCFFRSDLREWCRQQPKGAYFVLSGQL